MRTRLLGTVLGVLVVGGGAWLVFPHLPGSVPEAADLRQEGAILAATGTFREDAKGQDAAHWGKGTLHLYRKPDGSLVLQIQDDFQSGRIPDPWIYLNSKANIDDEKDFNRDRGRKKFARLKSFTGTQDYPVRESLKEIRAVTIWCETFGAYIASANIFPVS